jgi:endonuclease YncB( thermonuclease family)
MMAKISVAMPSLIIFVLFALSPVGQITTVSADAGKARNIHIIDGDTIDDLGRRLRLVGFDAPSSVTTPASSGCSRPAPHRG